MGHLQEIMTDKATTCGQRGQLQGNCKNWPQCFVSKDMIYLSDIFNTLIVAKNKTKSYKIKKSMVKDAQLKVPIILQIDHTV